MIVIDYNKKHHTKIIHACAKALKQGRVIAYPTDTSYGLAADSTNIKAIKQLYKIKGRNFNKPSSLVVPSVAYAKKMAKFNKSASTLAKALWPGALTIVLKLEVKGQRLNVLSAGSGFIGLRMPNNNIAMDLCKKLGRAMTATSSNLSGKPDCYSAEEILAQFRNSKNKPDIIINVGKLAKRKPSTIVKITSPYPSLERRGESKIEILRTGPISAKKIAALLTTTH